MVLKTKKLLYITIRKMKKDYYSTLDLKKVTDNKTFLKTIKQSDKILSTE